MTNKDVQIDFDAPSTLRKWPSLNNERVNASWGAAPYLIAVVRQKFHLSSCPNFRDRLCTMFFAWQVPKIRRLYESIMTRGEHEQVGTVAFWLGFVGRLA
jgi:hypothetical protein